MRTPHLGRHLVRNLFHYTGQNLWFYAVVLIPLSQLVALEFTNPIWVALLAPFLLGERLTRVRILAALIGFIGVVIVAEPGGRPTPARPRRRPGRRNLLCAQHHLHSHAALKINWVALKRDRFDQHRRSLRIEVDGFGINYRYTFLCREPEFTVARDDSGRQPPAVALDVEHAICLPYATLLILEILPSAKSFSSWRLTR